MPARRPRRAARTLSFAASSCLVDAMETGFPEGPAGKRTAVLGCDNAPMFASAAMNLYSRDVDRLAAFYVGLGFTETFRTPGGGDPIHVELTLAGFTFGIADAEALAADHGLNPDLGGRPIELALRTDDVDRDHAALTAGGAPSLSAPHDVLDHLRLAWAADPEGNPIRLVQRR
jgi:predicted enzyme related to lactoylglutathione lyase